MSSIKNLTCRIVNTDTGQIYEEKFFSCNMSQSVRKPELETLLQKFYTLSLHIDRIGFECYAERDQQVVQQELF